MPEAAVPIAMTAGPAIGGFLQGRGAQPKLIDIPKPGQQYPGVSSAIEGGLLSTLGPAFQGLGQMARTGLPTNYMDSFNAIKEESQRGIAQGRANLMEKYGGAGMRWGSALAQGAADFESQTAKGFGSLLAEFARQSQESAAERQLRAGGILGGLGAELGTATYPKAVLAGGAGSPAGSAVQGGVQGLLNFLLYQSIYGGEGGGGGGGGNWPGLGAYPIISRNNPQTTAAPILGGLSY